MPNNVSRQRSLRFHGRNSLMHARRLVRRRARVAQRAVRRGDRRSHAQNVRRNVRRGRRALGGSAAPGSFARQVRPRSDGATSTNLRGYYGKKPRNEPFSYGGKDGEL